MGEGKCSLPPAPSSLATHYTFYQRALSLSHHINWLRSRHNIKALATVSADQWRRKLRRGIKRVIAFMRIWWCVSSVCEAVHRLLQVGFSPSLCCFRIARSRGRVIEGGARRAAESLRTRGGLTAVPTASSLTICNSRVVVDCFITFFYKLYIIN